MNWICRECCETHEAHFSACWKCRYSRSGQRGIDLREDDPPAGPGLLRDRSFNWKRCLILFCLCGLIALKVGPAQCHRAHHCFLPSEVVVYDFPNRFAAYVSWPCLTLDHRLKPFRSRVAIVSGETPRDSSSGHSWENVVFWFPPVGWMR